MTDKPSEQVTEPIEHLQEKVLAGSLLTSGAGKAASVIDTFVSWLLAGAGAALALLIGNLSDIAQYLPVSTIIQFPPGVIT